MATVPIVVPLTEGMKEHISDNDARSPGISNATNVEFVRNGEITGRPGYVSHDSFQRRKVDTTTSNTSTGLTSSLATLVGVYGQSGNMFRYRDSAGERPGITFNGRTFTYEDNVWSDRLFGTGSSVDRIVEYFPFGPDPFQAVGALNETAVAFNFAQGDYVTSGNGSPLLGGTTPTIESYEKGKGTFLYGGSATVKISSDLYHCTIGNSGANTDLILVVRKNNDTTLSTFTVATDCLAVTVNTGEAPTCCAELASSVLWVCYKQTGGANYVLRAVNPTNGTTTTGPVATALANIIGMWIWPQHTAHTRLTLAFTQTATKGVACRQHNSSTLAAVGGGSVQFDGAATNNANGPVTVGGTTSGPVFIQYTRRSATAGSINVPGVVIGKYDPTGPTAVAVKTYEGFSTGGSAPINNAQWGIPFGPVSVGLRSVLGLSFSSYTPQVYHPFHTWYAVDFTDVIVAAGESKQDGTRQPGIVAMGPVQGSKIPSHPQSSVVDYTTVNLEFGSFRFPSFDFKQFSASGGLSPSLGLNKVVINSPQADFIGDQTVLSGSVPHCISGGYTFEQGFLQVAPEISVTLVAAGAGIADGSYTFQAVWVWQDEQGVYHRSAPSQIPFTLVVSAGAGAGKQFSAIVQNLQLTQREYGKIKIELYGTQINPTATAQKFLLDTVDQVAGSITTIIPTIQVPQGTELPLYTSAGAVLQNLPVSADGGVATVNNRMWLSDGRTLFASKQFKSDGNAAAWNDEGPLVLPIPNPAGKVLSLKNIEDKLIALCENGIYITQGLGPDDTGTGPGFLTPYRAKSVGVSNSHGAVTTQHGIVFHSSNAKLSGENTGGFYIFDGGNLLQLSGPTQQSLKQEKYILAYLEEKDTVFAGAGGSEANIHMYDLHMKQASLWTNPNGDSTQDLIGGGCLGLVGIGGMLWGTFNADGDLGINAVGAFTDVVTHRDITNATREIVMSVTTNNMYANGQDGLGWGRVRSVSVLGSMPSGSTHTLIVGFNTDQDVSVVFAPIATIVESTSTTWPHARNAPEFRLANQKCSQLKVKIQATPAIVSWSALRLDTLPSRAKAPQTTNRH